MRFSLWLFLVAAFLVFCILFGGGALPYRLSETAVRLASLTVLFFALSLWFRTPVSKRPKWIIPFCIAPTLYFIAQLIPVPRGFWGNLGNSALPAPVFALLPYPPDWTTTSLAPTATRLALFGLAPPVAAFIATLFLDWRERRVLICVLTALGVVSVGLGFLQVAQGSESDLRFYTDTGPTPVGFFANRNHFAALLYSLLVMAIGWIAMLLKQRTAARGQSRRVAFVAFAVTSVLLFSICQFVTNSRMGLALHGVALVLGYSMLLVPLTANVLFRRLRLAAAAGAALILFLFVFYGLAGMADRFDTASQGSDRLNFALTTLEAAKSFFPVGAGMGAFGQVFDAFQPKEQILPGLFVNHAHNDYAELLLETGLFGLLWMMAFIVWWTRSALQGRSVDFVTLDGSDFDPTIIRRVGLLVTGLLLFHSLVDYPLRTEALAALFGFACALQFSPLCRTRLGFADKG